MEKVSSQICLFEVLFFNIIVMDDGNDKHIFNTLCTNLHLI
jgi:hypothetical protein